MLPPLLVLQYQCYSTHSNIDITVSFPASPEMLHFNVWPKWIIGMTLLLSVLWHLCHCIIAAIIIIIVGIIIISVIVVYRLLGPAAARPRDRRPKLEDARPHMTGLSAQVSQLTTILFVTFTHSNKIQNYNYKFTFMYLSFCCIFQLQMWKYLDNNRSNRSVKTIHTTS